jgi:hypothetical protein
MAPIRQCRQIATESVNKFLVYTRVTDFATGSVYGFVYRSCKQLLYTHVVLPRGFRVGLGGRGGARFSGLGVQNFSYFSLPCMNLVGHPGRGWGIRTPCMASAAPAGGVSSVPK